MLKLNICSGVKLVVLEKESTGMILDNGKIMRADYSESRELIEYYRHEYDIFQNSYYLMGMLLNDDQIIRRVGELSLIECYIYGGGFLGIQTYRVLSRYVSVKAIVDGRGSLKFDCPDISVIDIEELRNNYRGETIIITPVQFAKEIYSELSRFVENEKLIFLGELVQGGV